MDVGRGDIVELPTNQLPECSLEVVEVVEVEVVEVEVVEVKVLEVKVYKQMSVLHYCNVTACYYAGQQDRNLFVSFSAQYAVLNDHFFFGRLFSSLPTNL